jgi:hypothetical protein
MLLPYTGHSTSRIVAAARTSQPGVSRTGVDPQETVTDDSSAYQAS